MGREIVYCEICGDRILEQEFEKGRAITLLNKKYCAKCKEQAIRNVGIEDAGAEPLSPSLPLPDATTVKASTPRSAHKPAPVASSLRSTTGRRSRSNTPLLVGVLVGVAALAALFLLVVGGRDTDEPPSPSQSATETPKKQDKAQLAIGKLREMVRTGADPQKILEQCNAAIGVIAGTAYQSELAAIEKEAQRKLNATKASRELDRILDEIQGVITRDRDFLKHEEVVALFDRAMTVVRDQPQREPEVADVNKKYLTRYNEAAERHFETVSREAEELATDNRYADAVRVIEEKFPAQFKHSTYWPNLEMLINRYKANQENAEAVPPDDDEPPRRDPDAIGPDGIPGAPLPPLGVWTTVFDGKSMDGFYRLRQADEKSGNWTIENGALVGVSSVPNPDEDTAAADFVVLRYPNLSDFELEWKMKVEGMGGVCGGRFAIRSSNVTGGMAEITDTDWATYEMKFEGNSLIFTKNGARIPCVDMDMAETGRVFFSIYPGSKLFVKDVKILRKK
ncbi:MAG: hypothetical protein HYY16_11085 [Planctomycetes bacterium]|nr:hypothetical protein [Planctomycetota bacterium]